MVRVAGTCFCVPPSRKNVAGHSYSVRAASFRSTVHLADGGIAEPAAGRRNTGSDHEVHHDTVRALETVAITSSLARVEIVAAFYGKARSGEIEVATAQVLAEVFTTDWDAGRFLRISSDEQIEREAAGLAARYLVRGFDAVHLATANAARRAVTDCQLFVCFDARLNRAAAGEQFQLLLV